MNKLFVVFIILLIPRLAISNLTEYDSLQIQVDEYLKEAFNLYNSSEFEKAITVYKKALDLKPDYAPIWYWLGRSYYRAGQMDQFFSAWDRFVRLSKEETHEITQKMNMYLEEVNLPSNIYEYLDTIKGKGETEFYNPTGISIDSEDNIYISSFGSNAIFKFSPIGNLLLRFGSKGKSKGKLDRPYGIALDMEDNIYVTDSGNHRVQKFSPEGKFLMEFGKKGRKLGEFINPKGITLDKEGNIYVVDSGNSRIQIFSKEGKLIGKIGKMGKTKNTLLNPIGIALDDKGGVWIIEHKYVKKFTTTDNFEKTVTLPQKGLIPQGITYSQDGKLYITFLQGIIFRFDIERQRWEMVSITSNLSTPSALTINKYGLLYVSNFDNNSISIFMPEEFKKNQFDVLVHRVDTNDYPTLTIPVTVTTQDKIPILGMTFNNFKVEENGRWMRPITISTPVYNNKYLVTTFIIDTSKEMAKYGDDVKKILNKFVDDMEGGNQAVSIIGFCKKPTQIQQITRNKTVLRDKIEELAFGNAKDKDALFWAIRVGVKNMVDLVCKKAICLITCGNEVEEGTLFRECSYYAKNNLIPIFVVDYRLQGETKSMKNLATHSLGNYFLAYKSLEAQRLYKSISSSPNVKNQNIYFISYQSPQEEWALTWTNVTISAGHRHLYAKDKIGYFVPKGKGMDKEIVERIAKRIEEKKLKEMAKKAEKEKKAPHKKEAKGHGEGHGEKKKIEGFPPPKDWEEGISIDIGAPDREEYVTDEEEAKAAASAAHGGGH